MNSSYAFFISLMRSIVTTYSIYPPAITNGKNSIIYNILYTVDYYTGVRLDHRPKSPPQPSPSP